MQSKNKFWWPLELSVNEKKAFDDFTKLVGREVANVRSKEIKDASLKLSYAIKEHVICILDRDGLPHSSHLMNGWGNLIYNGKTLLQTMESFAQTKSDDSYFFMQCDPEGDFHPWQSFAYAVMAGVDPDIEVIDSGVSLRQLAKNSREINTHEGRELGHLLFALAYLEPNINGAPFSLAGKLYSIHELFKLGVDAHHYGTFEVCRKFHLTEGLCAAAAKIPGLEKYRTLSQKFLDGQMDMLILLALSLHEVKKSNMCGKPVKDNILIQQLRETLRIGHLIENHYYYAGHLIELATFAKSQGYNISNIHWNAMAFVINVLNSHLDDYLPHLSIQDCFFALGHYRRAITLFDIIKNKFIDGGLERHQLQKYTVNFDKLGSVSNKISSVIKPLGLAEGGNYDISIIQKKSRAKFSQTIKIYTIIAKQNLQPRGQFGHFRRISPPSWPRAFHYELLDYGDKIGIEIHLESDSVLPMRPFVSALKNKLTSKFYDNFVEWDPSWYNGRGRFRIIFADDVPADEIAVKSNMFIEETFCELDNAAKSLRVNPLSLGYSLTNSQA